jgi:hypothetical protein
VLATDKAYMTRVAMVNDDEMMMVMVMMMMMMIMMMMMMMMMMMVIEVILDYDTADWCVMYAVTTESSTRGCSCWPPTRAT